MIRVTTPHFSSTRGGSAHAFTPPPTRYRPEVKQSWVKQLFAPPPPKSSFSFEDFLLKEATRDNGISYRKMGEGTRQPPAEEIVKTFHVGQINGAEFGPGMRTKETATAHIGKSGTLYFNVASTDTHNNVVLMWSGGVRKVDYHELWYKAGNANQLFKAAAEKAGF